MGIGTATLCLIFLSGMWGAFGILFFGALTIAQKRKSSTRSDIKGAAYTGFGFGFFGGILAVIAYQLF